MNRSIKKRAVALSVAAIISVSSCFAATNKLIDVRFEESGGNVVVTVYSQKGFSTAVKAVKSGQYYNIILPNVDKGSFTKLTPGGQIEFVRVSSVTSSNGNYTKLQIKPIGSVTVAARGEVATSDMLSAMANVAPNSIEQNFDSGEDHSGEQMGIGEEPPLEAEMSEMHSHEGANFEETSTQKVSQNKLSDEQIVLPVSSSPVLNEKPKRSHASEIFNILIGSMAVLLIVVLLYMNGKTRMKQLCGDMGVDFDDDEGKAKKEEAKRIKKEEQERKRVEKEKKRIAELEKKSAQKALKAQKAAELATEKMLKKAKLVDLETSPNPEPTEPVVSDESSEAVIATSDSIAFEQPKAVATSQVVEDDEDDYDLDEFLESFVDKDDEDEETPDRAEENSAESDEAEEAFVGENPLDGLIDDVIATQGITFSEADLEVLQKGLQSEVSGDIVEQVLASKQTEEVKPKKQYVPLTLEEFDKNNSEISDNVINEIIGKTDIKFDKADRKAVYEVMATYDMPTSAIEEARIRKANLDRENLSHYEKEQGFAFTLVKTDDVVTAQDSIAEEYPDVMNADFSGDAILQEFSLISPEAQIENEAPTLDDIEAAMANVKLSEMTEEEAKQYEKPEKDSILSEFTLIKPDVESKKNVDDGFSSTVFTSMEDIESQFRALGLDFDSKKTNEEEEVSELNETEEDFVEEPLEASKTSDEMEVYARCVVDETSELCVAYYEGKTQLIGVKNNGITPLYEFEEGDAPSRLSARAAEETEVGKRYIVRADKHKFVVEVTASKIEMVLVL